MTTTALVSNLSGLPEEIFQNVLEKWRNSSSLSAFLPCLLVCKRWNKIGNLVAWTALKITSHNLEDFIASTILNNERLRRCKYLTINLHAPFPELCDCGADWFEDDMVVGQNHCHRQNDHHDDTTQREFQKHLRLLSLTIEQYFKSLVTFSFTIDNEPMDGLWCGCIEPNISVVVFAQILKALPRTCVNLELDTGGTDYSCVHRSDDIVCAGVRRLLPQLHSLRLRVAHICPGCIPPRGKADEEVQLELRAPLEHLSTCTINLITFPRTQKAAFCGTYKGPGKSSSAAEHRVAIEMAKTFRNALQDGLFPKIRGLSVFDATKMAGKKYYYPYEEYGDVEPAICLFGDIDSILHFDVLRNRTTSLPFHPFDENRDYEGLRMRHFKSSILKRADRRYLVGSLADFEHDLEGTWASTSDGLRLPKSFQISQEGGEAGFIWNRGTIVSHPQSYIVDLVQKTRQRHILEHRCLDEFENETVFDYVLDFDANIKDGFVKIRPEAAACPPRFSPLYAERRRQARYLECLDTDEESGSESCYSL